MGFMATELMAAAWDSNSDSNNPSYGVDDAQLQQRSSLIRRHEIVPLDSVSHTGLIAISVLAVISMCATFGLICFITYRFIFWKKHYKRSPTNNQYIVLIYNLVLADFLQALAFVLCGHWVALDAIKSGTAACVLQGLLLQAGDPGSGLFVLTIAGHTFLLVTSGKLVPHKWFALGVVGVWLFLGILVTIPMASHGLGVFGVSGIWCWIDADYEPFRLYTHYIWIFLAEFGTVVLYTIMFFQLRRQMAASTILAGSHQMESLKRLRRVVSYMVIYPVAYVVLSLPLAAGRMATAQGKTPSKAYFCVAGAMMTSSGFVDVLLYTLTRRSLMINSEVSGHQGNYANMDQSNSKGKISRLISSNSKGLTTMTTTITSHVDRSGEGSGFRRGRAAPDHETIYSTDSQENNANTSTENIVQKDVELVPLGKVYQQTTIEVRSEPAPYHPQNARNGDNGKDW